MTHIEREAFIREHVETVLNQVLSKVSKMPESWEGLELKQYVADGFQIPKRWMDPKRRRNYNNTILTTSL